VRSGNTYTANGTAELIKEIVVNIKIDDLEIMFRMDSGYFDEEIIETIESLGIVQQFFCKMIWLSSEFDFGIWKCGHHFVLAHITTSPAATSKYLHL
jgi:hypothetical protein